MANSTWTSRLVDAPEQDILHMVDVQKLIGLGEDALRQLIRDGEFPAALTIGRQQKVWEWRDIAFYRLRLAMGHRISVTPDEPKKANGKQAGTGEA